MSDLFRAFMLALPFLLIALLGALLWGPMRRMRARDKVSPPTPRAFTLRLLPFAAISAAATIWGLLVERYDIAAWGAIGVLCFGFALVGYARHRM